MAARRAGRYLAPIALLAAAAAIALVVKDHVHTGSHPATSNSAGGSLVHTFRQAGHKPSHHRPARKSYTVKPGDTLSQISQATGVSVSAILRLNHGLNPNALQTGQSLRLRR
jgi:LysM repeat protein